jgi:hypothetical protein
MEPTDIVFGVTKEDIDDMAESEGVSLDLIEYGEICDALACSDAVWDLIRNKIIELKE